MKKLAVHKYLDLEMNCPRCGKTDVPVEVELKLGRIDMIRFKLGDMAADLENCSGVYEQYAVCERCERDFFVAVSVSKGVFVSVEYVAEREPHIPGPRSLK